VLAVAAATLSDRRKSNSNWGERIDLAGPGEQIWAPRPGDLGNSYDFSFGDTSGAAPMVTGVAGLLKALKPELTPAQIKQILIETADPIQTGETNKRIGTGCYSNPNDTLNTGCRLNALRAVQRVLDGNIIFDSFGPGNSYDPHNGASIGRPDIGVSTSGFTFTSAQTVKLNRIDIPVCLIEGPNAFSLALQAADGPSNSPGTVLESFQVVGQMGPCGFNNPVITVAGVLQPMLRAGGLRHSGYDIPGDVARHIRSERCPTW
jgi:hypothetical protein